MKGDVFDPKKVIESIRSEPSLSKSDLILEELQKIRPKCQPLLNKFIVLYSDKTSLWPDKPNILKIPKKEINAFRAVLLEKLGLDMDDDSVHKLLESEMIEQSEK